MTETQDEKEDRVTKEITDADAAGDVTAWLKAAKEVMTFSRTVLFTVRPDTYQKLREAAEVFALLGGYMKSNPEGVPEMAVTFAGVPVRSKK